MTGSRCWPARTGPRRPGSGRWPPPWSGATSCWMSTSGGCSARCRCSPGRSRWRRPRRSPGPAPGRRCCTWWTARCWSRRGPGPDGRSRYRDAGDAARLRGPAAGPGRGAGRRPRPRWPGTRWAWPRRPRRGCRPAPGSWPRRGWLDAEDATMRQVLAWAMDHDPDMAVRLAAALGCGGCCAAGWPARSPLLREARRARRAGQRGVVRRAVLARPWTAFDAADLPGALERFTAVCDVIADREPSRAAGGLPGPAVGGLGQSGPGPGGGR